MFTLQSGFRRLADIPLVLFLLAAVFVTYTAAQKDVPLKQSWIAEARSCLMVETQVYNAASLEYMARIAGCAEIFKTQPVDFKKETLIGYHVGGDCHMRVSSNLTRDDKAKLVTVHINKNYGGCRAGGWKQSLFSIDKIPDDYRVKFKEYRFDRMRGGEQIKVIDEDNEIWTAGGYKVEPDGTLTPPKVLEKPKPQLPVETVKTREIDLDNCVQFFRGGVKDRMIVRNNAEFLAAIRDDASREHCLKKTEKLKIDFDKSILYGITLSTGYCFRPPGLEYSVTSDPNNKHYTFHVFYRLAGADRCRALVPYDLWVLAPKEPAGYYPTFDVVEAKAGYIK